MEGSYRDYVCPVLCGNPCVLPSCMEDPSGSINADSSSQLSGRATSTICVFCCVHCYGTMDSSRKGKPTSSFGVRSSQGDAPIHAVGLVEVRSEIADSMPVICSSCTSARRFLIASSACLQIPWAHLDIAGAAWDHKAHIATGFGAQTLAEWAISQGQ